MIVKKKANVFCRIVKRDGIGLHRRNIKDTIDCLLSFLEKRVTEDGAVLTGSSALKVKIRLEKVYLFLNCKEVVCLVILL